MDGGGTRRGLSGCVGPKKTEEKEEAGGCVWARRDPGGRLGKAAGMDGDGSGYLKGKATPRSAPGHPFFPVALGVLGRGHGSPRQWAESGAFGGVCRRLGGGKRYQGCSAPILPGYRMRALGCGMAAVYLAWGGSWITQHPTASSCHRGGKPAPEQQDPAAS